MNRWWFRLMSVFALVVSLAACANEESVTPTAVFDPASPERQNAASLCKSDSTCSAPDTGTYADVYWLTACTWASMNNTPWDQRGYNFIVSINRVETTRRVSVRLQLRAGSLATRYRVTLQRNDGFSTTPRVIDEDMTVSQIQAGFELELGSGRLSGWGDTVNLVFVLRPLGEPEVRTIQWALPPDGVFDLDRRVSLNRCLLVGPFLRLPEHGVLHLAQGADDSPECQGMPRAIDHPDRAAYAYYGALVRERSNPTIYYISGPGRWVGHFHDLRSFMDWATPWRVCAEVSVIPDGSIVALRDWERREIGVRPQILVTWLAPDGRRRRGITSHDWLVYDFTDQIGPMGEVDPGMITGVRCSLYALYRNDTPASTRDCLLDIQPLIGNYQIRPGVLPYRGDDPYLPTIESYFVRPRTP